MSSDRRDDYDDDDRPARRERAHYDEPHRGGMMLALGIISLVVCPVVGIVAWIMASGDLRAMEEGRMDPEGKQFTQVGKILGIVGTILFALQMGFLLLYLVGFAVLVGMK
jgi:hypothetical protein